MQSMALLYYRWHDSYCTPHVAISYIHNQPHRIDYGASSTQMVCRVSHGHTHAGVLVSSPSLILTITIHITIMAAFVRLITRPNGNKPSPPIHDDDVIYPLHILDNAKTLRSFVVA